MNSQFKARLNRLQSICLIVGLIALAGTFVCAFTDRRQFFFSYLFAWLFWLGLSLGCFNITMIHNLTGGRWGYPTRRFLEAGFMVLPLMVALFVPVFFGLKQLYPWAQSALFGNDSIVRHRHAWQNTPLFIARSAIFLVACLYTAWRLRSYSLEQDTTSNAAPTRKARVLSGPGVVLFSLIATFIYIDWIMSLEPHWRSTMFGVIVLIGQILAGFSFAILMVTLFRGEEPLSQVLTRTHYHHLGNLLLTFVLFWTYISFGQLLIIYSGDIPEEIEWYLHRIAANWKGVVGALALLHFFVPFYLLLFRAVKRHVAPLGVIAGVVFVMHIVDAYWLVMPAFHQNGVALHWADFTAPIGIGGLWFAFFFARLKSAPLLPQQDPGMQFAFRYAH